MEKPQYTAAHLKGMNRHVVYDFSRERGATSKAQIVKETGISPPTVIKIVSYLVERGLVVEAGEGAASADDGLIGMAAHITRMEVDALLEEE